MKMNTGEEINLGKWVILQRQQYRKGLLSSKRIKELESLSGWAWKTRNIGNFLSFKEVKELVRSLGLKNQKEWNKYCNSNKRTENIPSNPWVTYKDSGWISWGDFLGTKPGFDGTHLPFKEARIFVRSLKLKSSTEWREWSKIKRPDNIPSAPYGVYKKEWISWGDWLGTE